MLSWLRKKPPVVVDKTDEPIICGREWMAADDGDEGWKVYSIKAGMDPEGKYAFCTTTRANAEALVKLFDDYVGRTATSADLEERVALEKELCARVADAHAEECIARSKEYGDVGNEDEADGWMERACAAQDVARKIRTKGEA